MCLCTHSTLYESIVLVLQLEPLQGQWYYSRCWWRVLLQNHWTVMHWMPSCTSLLLTPVCLKQEVWNLLKSCGTPSRLVLYWSQLLVKHLFIHNVIFIWCANHICGWYCRVLKSIIWWLWISLTGLLPMVGSHNWGISCWGL